MKPATASFQLTENVDVTALSTLRIPARARYLAVARHQNQIPAIVTFAAENHLPLVVVGEGSNLVWQDDFPGVVLQLEITKVSLNHQSDNQLFLTAEAGVNWHQLVKQAVNDGWRGIENLALIPGTVGAAPVQNIGAYGVELADRLVEVRAFDRQTGDWLSMNREQCRFGYRSSLFKQQAPDRYIISEVTLSLEKDIQYRLDYGPLAKRFEHSAPENAQAVFDAVCEIRRAKLPDPAEIPNCGSFFENPVVSPDQMATLRQRFPDLVYFSMPDGGFKLAAGWLIEYCGWKGKWVGHLCMYEKQALVLTQDGQASRQALFGFIRQVRESVAATFGIWLTQEPVCYPRPPLSLP